MVGCDVFGDAMRLTPGRLLRSLRRRKAKAKAVVSPVQNDTQHVLRGAVDRQFYFIHHPDVAAAGMDPAEHYDRFGWKEGRDPSPWFSTNGYLKDHADVAAAGVNPFVHFLLAGRNEHRGVRPSELVLSHPLQGAALAMLRWEIDQDYYLAQVERSGLSTQGLDPAIHYVLVGADRGLNPVPWFSTHFYRQSNQDIVERGINPFLHYLVYGRSENRTPDNIAQGSTSLVVSTDTQTSKDADVRRADPTASEIEAMRAVLAPRFSIPFYLGMNPDVAAANIDPIVHFLHHGWREGRDPSPYFSVSNYLEMNEDVRRADINPYYHYIVSGEKEGRLPKLELGFRYGILKEHKERLSEKISAGRACFDVGVDVGASMALTEATARLGKAKGLYLSVSHDDFFKNFGGIQLILQREFKALRAMNYHHLHLYPALPQSVVDLDDDESIVGVILNGEYIGRLAVSTLVKILAKLPPAVGAQRWFAIHSLLGHSSTALTRMMKSLGFQKGWFWIHDYAGICSNYTLLRNDVEFCGAPPIASISCQICRYGELRAAQVAEHSQLFRQFSITLAAPSETALAVFESGGSHKAVGSTILEHCKVKSLPIVETSTDVAVVKKTKKTRPLRVGFLGLPANHKGWPVFMELALSYSEDARYEFHVFGKREPAGLPMQFHSVVVSSDNLNAMTDAVSGAEIDVVIQWSIWPETFCFAAHEALAGGSALIGHRNGGHVTKLIEKQRCGVVLDDERQLKDLFETGDVQKFARSQRSPKRYALVHSNLTADLLKAAAR